MGTLPSFGNILSGLSSIGGGGQGGSRTSPPPQQSLPATSTANILTNPLTGSQAAVGQTPGQGGTQSNVSSTPTFAPPPPTEKPQPPAPAPTATPPAQAEAPYLYQTGIPTRQTYVPDQNVPPTPTPGVAQTPSGLPQNVTTMGLPLEQPTAPVAAAPTTPPPAAEPTPPTAPAAAARPTAPQQEQDLHLGPLKPLFDLFTKGPQAFMQDLQSLNQQVGGAYQPQQQYGPQGYTPHGYGYGDTQPQPRQPTRAPTTTPQSTATQPSGTQQPGWAGQAIRAGFDRASQDEARQRQATGRGPPGSQEPASPSGGPPSDTPSIGNVQQSIDYIAAHGGYSQTGFNRVQGAYGAYKANPEFSNRLTAAGQAYERETGIPPKYGLGDRDPETQRYYWEDSRGGTRYAAAPPGRSLHQSGLAMDMPPDSSFTAWLKQGNAQRFGLGFPVPHDANHIQMQDIHNRPYPYAAAPVENNFHPEIARGQQAALTNIGRGVIPGSQLPAGTRPGDQFYNPGTYARAVFGIESGGNRFARTGSNRGLGQFGPQEERMYGINARNRADPNAQYAALQREAQDHSEVLRKDLGRDPEAWELYFTHQQGRAGGPALLTADGNTPAWQAIRRFYGSDAIAQRAIHGNIPSNNPLHNVPASQITAEQFRNLWRDRFNQDYQPGGQQSRAPSELTRLALSERAMQSANPNRFPLTREEEQRGRENVPRTKHNIEPEPSIDWKGFWYGPRERPEFRGGQGGGFLGRRGQLDDLIRQLGLT